MRSISEQIALFALVVTLGIVLGLIFDFYRALRGVIEPGKILTVLGDILFWLVATALVFSVLMWKTWGEMRAYVLIGLVLGFIIHWYYFSPLTLKIFHSLLLFIIWIAKIIWRILSWPFLTAKKALLVPVMYLLAFGKAGQRQIKAQNNKCRNFVKEKLKKIFSRPPKDE